MFTPYYMNPIIAAIASRGAAVTAAIKVVPGDTNTFYVVSRAADGTVISHRIGRNNLGDSSTPPASIGTPFQPFRDTGTKQLADYSGAAWTGSYTYAEDIGAEDYAMQVAGIYGGSYHGGETKSTETVTIDGGAVDPTVGGSGTSNVVVAHTSTIDWGGGNTAAMTTSVTFGLDGSITDVFSITSSANASNIFLGMGIATGAGYTEAAYLDGGGISRPLPLVDGTTYMLTITVRDPTTGRYQRSVSTAPAQSGYRRTKLIRSSAFARTKVYYEFVTGAIGTKTNGTRTRTFGQGAAGANVFTNLVSNGDFSGGLTGWNLTHNAAGISLVSGAMRFTRDAANDTRANKPVTCVVGKTYLAAARVLNDSTGSVYAACSLVVGNNSNGSTSAPAALQTYQGVESLGVMFVATQTTHYIMGYLLAGTAGQTIDFDNFQVIQLD